MTGERNTGQRYHFTNGRLQKADPPPARKWTFPDPFGEQEVVPLMLTETIAIARHLHTTEIRAYLNDAPLKDLHDPATPEPVPADESGRSAQLFLVDVIVRRGNDERRMIATGRDIYAVTAPIVVEAAERVLNGRVKRRGVVTAGEAFDAKDFLSSLRPRVSFPCALERYLR